MRERDSYRDGSGYYPLRKIRTALAGVSYAVFKDFSVRYKLIVSLLFMEFPGRGPLDFLHEGFA